MPRPTQPYQLATPKISHTANGYRCTYYRDYEDGSAEFVASKFYKFNPKARSYTFHEAPFEREIMSPIIARTAWKVCQIVDANRNLISYVNKI